MEEKSFRISWDLPCLSAAILTLEHVSHLILLPEFAESATRDAHRSISEVPAKLSRSAASLLHDRASETSYNVTAYSVIVMTSGSYESSSRKLRLVNSSNSGVCLPIVPRQIR